MISVIFDCDGVLVDSEKLSCGAWLPVLHRRGIKADLADIEGFIGRSEHAVLDHFQEKIGKALGGDPITEKEEEYYRTAPDSHERYPGLMEVLQLLRDKGTPVAVASSGRPDKIRFSLERTGLTPFFPIICSATEVRRGKPYPDLFLLASDRLAIPPSDCWVVEDSIPGIQAAVAAGMPSIGFTSSHDAAALLKAGAQRTFEHYLELPELLRSGAK